MTDEANNTPVNDDWFEHHTQYLRSLRGMARQGLSTDRLWGKEIKRLEDEYSRDFGGNATSGPAVSLADVASGSPERPEEDAR